MSRNLPDAAHRKIGLDFVRSVAILCVIACHLTGRYFSFPYSIVYPVGVLGVEIFFVLSGYLVGGMFLKELAAHQGRVTARMVGEFWARRWLRTVPNYLLFLGVGAWLTPLNKEQTILSYLTFTQNLAWPMPRFFHESWSLALEEWFYLLLPALVFSLYVVTRRARLAFLTVVAALFVGPLTLRLLVAPGFAWDAGVRKVVIFRPDALMWGVILVTLERYRPLAYGRLQGWSTFVAGLGLGAASLIYTGWRYHQGRAGDFIATPWDAFIFSGFSISCALALPFCAAISTPNRFAALVGQRISIWSYAMYLSHAPAMALTTMVLRAGGATREPITEAAGAFIVTLAISAFVYHLFEHPIMRLRERLFPARSRRPAADEACPGAATSAVT